ncbi:MAG TPA: hypothetical protein DEQ02_10700 [Ruminococcaceae bacterium]|nr:hypothetical protein [Oscillospiraceae bacterium]
MEMHDFDLKEFMTVLDSCEGDVYMVTDEGDRLNLKSKLTQLIGFTALIEGGTVTEARIECTSKADEQKLFRFNLFGETPQ